MARQRLQASTKRRTSALLLVRHTINLNLAIHHHAGLHTGPRRRMLRLEILPEHLVETPEIPRILQPHPDPHHILQAVPRLLQNRHHIAHRLMRLLNDATMNNFAIQCRHLTGHIQPTIGLNSTSERTRLATACGAAGAVASDAHGVFS
ncbi:hypothetical protein EMIT048CA2_180003 [Pseudomonas chlororaphis]